MVAPPKGLDEALNFFHSRKLPLGSWEHWLRSCCESVDRQTNYMCNWSLLLGLTVGMLEVSNTQRHYRGALRSFRRPTQKRFIAHFIMLADALTGATTQDLHIVYGVRGVRAKIPARLLDWPVEPAETDALLERIRPKNLPKLLSRDGYAEFCPNLVYGYFRATQNPAALRKLYLCRASAPGVIKGIRDSDPAVKAYFDQQLAAAVALHLSSSRH